jgi:hypothetical protein
LNEVVVDGATDTLMKIRPQTYDKTRSIGGDEAGALNPSTNKRVMDTLTMN